MVHMASELNGIRIEWHHRNQSNKTKLGYFHFKGHLKQACISKRWISAATIMAVAHLPDPCASYRRLAM